MAMPVLRPVAGFCFQAESSGSTPHRWYINMCKHNFVEMPVAYSGKVVDREFLLTHGIGNLRVPFDMGTFRKLKSQADGSRKTSYCIDAVFNPLVVKLYMDDDFCNKMEKYRPFVTNLVLARIEESVGVKLPLSTVKLVKKCRYKDGEGSDGITAKEFTELPNDQDDLNAQDVYVPPAVQARADEAAARDAASPLIQEVGGKKKPAIKKGFLNSPGTEIYPPEGSGEGVLPENAGDPMGWMPKKLRQTSKIIDCNSPEYQNHEKKKQEADSTNAMRKEFNDTLQSDMARWCKNHDTNSRWEEDLPEGCEAPATKKYDVDYKRFDQVADVEEAPTTEERDYYYDTNGQIRQIGQKPSTTTTPGATKHAEPTLKKGFLDGAKSALYPNGSEQAADIADDAKMMADMQKMFAGANPGGDMAEMQKMFAGTNPGGDMADDAKMMAEMQKMFAGANPADEAGGPSRAGPSLSSTKGPQRSAAEFKLDWSADGSSLQLVVSVPGVTSMSGVDLDVTGKRASLDFPSEACLRPLHVDLPATVDPVATRAKFSKKLQKITVTLPVA